VWLPAAGTSFKDLMLAASCRVLIKASADIRSIASSIEASIRNDFPNFDASITEEAANHAAIKVDMDPKGSDTKLIKNIWSLNQLEITLGLTTPNVEGSTLIVKMFPIAIVPRKLFGTIEQVLLANAINHVVTCGIEN
jgi:hypothetical protein